MVANVPSVFWALVQGHQELVREIKQGNKLRVSLRKDAAYTSAVNEPLGADYLTVNQSHTPKAWITRTAAEYHILSSPTRSTRSQLPGPVRSHTTSDFQI